MIAEIAGIVALGLGIAMLVMALPKDGKAAAFIRKSEVVEVCYTLAVTFLLAGGAGGMLLGVVG